MTNQKFELQFDDVIQPEESIKKRLNLLELLK